MQLRIFQLHMKGWTNVKIAHELGISEMTVTNAKNHPEFLELKREATSTIVQEVASGKSDIAGFSPMQLAKTVAPRMMQILIGIAESPRTPPAVKAKVADGVLDRVLGKATQRVVVDRLDEILEQCSDDEVQHYIKTQQLPDRFSDASRTVH